MAEERRLTEVRKLDKQHPDSRFQQNSGTKKTKPKPQQQRINRR